LTSTPVVEQIVRFGRLLRQTGLEVGPQRIQNALRGLDSVGLGRRDDVYWVLRQTLVSRAEDFAAFDSAFAAWFEQSVMDHGLATATDPASDAALATDEFGEEIGADLDSEIRSIGWSATEVLRNKDFASLTPDELELVKRLIARLVRNRPVRHSRRLRAHPRGHVLDLRRLSRGAVGTGGELIGRAYRRRARVPRKVVLLCDVSGSMEAYAQLLLLFFHSVVGTGRGVEAFAFGTRLTRLTRDLAQRDPEQALAAAAERVVDWTGGTRIGASLKMFNDEWGRRTLTRGAVVVIASDGWERGDTSVVDREMGRLARAAYAVIWVNPLKGNPEYQPLAGGMRAALPYIDRFVAGHDLRSLETLGALLSGIERRHAT
jgi:uncharacterized protein with von Willebrand factor type A (vWA) domain